MSMTPNRPLSEEVVAAVANRENIDQMNLNPPLFDVIDPDALNSLFQGDSGEVIFEFHDLRVAVDNAGNVTLREIGH
ncbi:MAG: HalOD1 output domain-containing protein [Natronomonas sp.]